jgi:hypothetical protein
VKTFIRYAPGAGGTYVALIAYALSNDITASFKNGNAHDYRRLYSESNNYDKLAHGNCLERNPDSFKLFQYYTEEEYHTEFSDAADGIEWFKNNLVFDNSPRHYICTHARNLNALIPAVNDANIINVTMQDSDIDQICYNFVTKAIVTEPQWGHERANDVLPALAHWYPHKAITYNQLIDAVAKKDIKFLTWLIKYSWKNYWEKYSLYSPPAEFKILNITWDEVNSTQLINKIDLIADFLNVELTIERKNNVIKLIQTWANNQVVIPFNVSLDDF